MQDTPPPPTSHAKDSDTQASLADRAHRLVLLIMLLIMMVELAFLVADSRWMHVFLVVVMMCVMLVPLMPGLRWQVRIPSEIQLPAILFIFAAIFLGEVHDYYLRIWWWDLALHTTAGLLLGLLGFLVVYLLNEKTAVNMRMRPSFVAMFAFFFSVGLGALWEIFEFAMDQLVGTNMQKPAFGDPSGLTDTMWDLVVDTLGAAIVSISGWIYMRRERRHWVDAWAMRLMQGNPRLFKEL